MLSDSELDALRTQLETLTMPQSVAISRATETVSAAGDPVKVWATTSTVSGRVDPYTRGSGGYIVAEQEVGRAYYQLTIEHDADLNDGDRVIVSGTTYEVLQLHEGNALAAVKRALIVRHG
jgi:SPP1 family predicted phage head-tail adaptor